MPTDSGVRGRGGARRLPVRRRARHRRAKTDLGAVRLAETGPADLAAGSASEITVEGVSGSAEVHSGSSDIRIGTVDGHRRRLNAREACGGVVTGPRESRPPRFGVRRPARCPTSPPPAQRRGADRRGRARRGCRHVKNGGVESRPARARAWLELDTGVGRVYTSSASSDAPERRAGRQVEVHASTKLGDVTIRRAPRGRGGVNTVIPPPARSPPSPQSRQAASPVIGEKTVLDGID